MSEEIEIKIKEVLENENEGGYQLKKVQLHHVLKNLMPDKTARHTLVDSLLSTIWNVLHGGPEVRRRYGLTHVEHAIVLHMVGPQDPEWLKAIRQWLNCSELCVSADRWCYVCDVTAQIGGDAVPPAVKVVRDLITSFGSEEVVDIKQISNAEGDPREGRQKEVATSGIGAVHETIETTTTGKETREPTTKEAAASSQQGLTVKPMPFVGTEVVKIISRNGTRPDIPEVSKHLLAYGYKVGWLRHKTWWGKGAVTIVCLPGEISDAILQKLACVMLGCARRQDGTMEMDIYPPRARWALRVVRKELRAQKQE